MMKGTVIAGLALLLVGTAAFAADDDEDAKDPETKRCLRLSQVDTTKVIDSRHIVFEMKDNSLYVTRLPHRCPGLRPNTSWMHSTHSNDICDLDTITVLDNFGGGFQRGATCGLGKFEPLAKPDLDALRAQLEEQKEAERNK